MKINAKLVKKLRDFSGAGMLEVKKALVATKGEFDAAIEYLKERGLSKAEKKVGRIAADGLVGVLTKNNKAVIMELNCETDFVALTDDFQKLFLDIISAILNKDIKTTEEANELMIGDKTILIIVKEATARIGEKIQLRRFEVINKTDDQNFGNYVHSNKKIASLVIVDKGSEETARNVSMHLTAMNPQYMTSADISSEKIDEYKAKILKEMESMNKPQAIKEKIAEGKMKKILSEMVLVNQKFAMESKKSVSQYLKENKAKFFSAIRYEVGEGIEKKKDNFNEEVRSQMK